jgi:hypothetical protein
MNKRGNPKSLVPGHPGNFNAVKHGVHSRRLIQERGAEIERELTDAFAFSPPERLAAHEIGRCIALLEAIDRDLDDRGLVNKAGEPRYLLNHRARISRQLEQWLGKISPAIDRQLARREAPPRAESADYVRALQRIGLGHDATATARDRLTALKKLVDLGFEGTTTYLDQSSETDQLTRRWHAANEVDREQRLVEHERSLGIGEVADPQLEA